jgi:hypothetical protein
VFGKNFYERKKINGKDKRNVIMNHVLTEEEDACDNEYHLD